MANTRKEILEERRQLRAKYGDLYENLSAVLFRHDPMGINYGDNTDEYDTEVGTILPRLRGCKSEEESLLAIHEEFIRWFGSDGAGPREHYAVIANEIWQLWMKFNG